MRNKRVDDDRSKVARYPGAHLILIDQPIWPAHGMLWAHIVSDTSLDELHAFAASAGIQRRAFDHDHYDVPERSWNDLVALGAEPVTVRQLVERLRESGLRVTQREKRGL
jgi:hypothetical protein